MDHDTLLFSLVPLGNAEEDGYAASSVMLNFGVFQEDPERTALFASNRVGRPIAVMAEGTYYLKRTTPDGKVKYRPITFTREDIERLASSQPRDVPFNYDHKKGSGRDGVKGWLRFGDGLSHVGTLQTKSGPKAALFATPELSEEAQSLVAEGIYRDVSVEYREADKVLTGIALTSYPVMRDLQFGEVLNEADADAAADTPEPPTSEDEAETAELGNQEGEEMDLTTLTEDQRKALLKDLLGAAGIDLEGIVKMGEDLEQAKKDAEAARHETLVTKTENVVRDALGPTYFGMTDEIATAAVDAMVWVDENATLNFGGEDGAPDLKKTIADLLGVIAKNGKQIALLGGETAGLDKDGAATFGEIEDEDPEVETDKDSDTRAKTLAEIAKSLL